MPAVGRFAIAGWHAAHQTRTIPFKSQKGTHPYSIPDRSNCVSTGKSQRGQHDRLRVHRRAGGLPQRTPPVCRNRAGAELPGAGGPQRVLLDRAPSAGRTRRAWPGPAGEVRRHRRAGPDHAGPGDRGAGLRRRERRGRARPGGPGRCAARPPGPGRGGGAVRPDADPRRDRCRDRGHRTLRRLGRRPPGRPGPVGARRLAAVKVGISVHDSLMIADPARRRALLSVIEQAVLDYVCVGDHVSFHDGTGFDGLTAATAALCGGGLPVLVGVYLLALRHPMLTARQLASISQLAPGRLTLGVGVAGEDRSEVANSGVDPATRGRRMDECLVVLRALASGEAVDHAGEFFQLSSACIKPAPDPPVPIVIGGKGEAAVRRAARYGDGWLAIFCSARRFAETKGQITEAAAALGRPAPPWYGINVWCGLDADAAQARRLLASQLEGLYHLPFGKFERLTPAGPPAQVAEALAPYRAAGAAHITLIPVAVSPEAGVEHAAGVRAMLDQVS